VTQLLIAFGIALCAACLGVAMGYVLWKLFMEDDD